MIKIKTERITNSKFTLRHYYFQCDDREKNSVINNTSARGKLLSSLGYHIMKNDKLEKSKKKDY